MDFDGTVTQMFMYIPGMLYVTFEFVNCLLFAIFWNMDMKVLS